ncbi:GNAT family N-acetyltransferase [Chryseobacterium sp.]|uniref:GNAT family N-acetyltransferase n=1 Tax=Chryseobacterium sp. TaxID=1871047 RepID=UPI0011C83A92|nr:GNAT family N-acetyltransferase [Chryseobacterium sp.]TXF77542.1 GNAT family N-acetyltransferase [Chryseobacterium sp.]
MLKIHQLNTSERTQLYREILTEFRCAEPYFLMDYINTFSNGLQDLICFSFTTKAGNKMIMPGYLKPVVIDDETTEYFDFSTPYGYTGPFISEQISDSDLTEFWTAVDSWYKSNKVITEFIRFNLSGNEKSYSGTVFPTMLNIKGKIVDENLQWTAFDHKVRKNVKKAIREGLTSQVFYHDISEERISEFYKIYIDTMQRTNAAKHFFYTLDQFKLFIKDNTDFAALCTVYFDDIPVSSELLLVSVDAIYSFLGGTVDTYFDKRPNDFLKVEALNWARLQGKKYYVLGGGYGYEDGIFKYKKSFFPNDVVSYYTGRKILNEEVYAELVEKVSALKEKRGFEPLHLDDTSFFPLYYKE